MYIFLCMQIHVCMHMYTYTDKMSVHMGRSKGPRTANTILKKKNKVGKLTPNDFKTYNKAVLIKPE